MSNISCKFWDPQSNSGKNSECKQNATKFVRVAASNRLCPLCDPCYDVFKNASESMPEDIKQNLPGHGKYVEVSLSDGSDEYAKQPPKT